VLISDTLFFNFPLQYAIRRDQVNHDGLKLNCSHWLLVYADDINILDRSKHTIKKTEASVVASKETALEINAEKTKYVVMSQVQNAR